MGLFDAFMALRVEVERLVIILDDTAVCLKMTEGKCILPDKKSKSLLYR